MQEKNITKPVGNHIMLSQIDTLHCHWNAKEGMQLAKMDILGQNDIKNCSEEIKPVAFAEVSQFVENLVNRTL